MGLSKNQSFALAITSLGLLFILSGCGSYKEIDFQTERCKQQPTGNIKVTDKGHFRWEFELEGTGKSVETENFRTVWMIEGTSFVAQRVSYQFESKGDQKISVIMTNRCFMQTAKEITIKVN